MSTDLPDFYPGAADVVSRPEWAAKQATDKTFLASGTSVAAGNGISIQYTVPAGRKLYLSDGQCSSHATATADADLNQMTDLAAYGPLVAHLSQAGGNGGVILGWRKPWVATAGQLVTMLANNRSGHTCDMSMRFAGWEEDT